MEKQNFEAEAYEQIKSLSGSTRESIHNIDTAIGAIQIVVKTEPDYNDRKQAGGFYWDRPWLYKVSINSVPESIANLCAEKTFDKAQDAYDYGVKVATTYAKGIKECENL